MNPKFVLVSQRIDWWKERGEKRDALDQRLVAFLKKCGFLAMPVPNVFEKKDLLSLCNVLKPAGFVLSGGNDIGTFPERDKLEKAMLELAIEKKMPLIGICRGMQMIVKFFGGELCPVKGHVRTLHRLTLVGQGFRLSPLVNSYHEFGVKSLPEELVALAFAEDGVVEAVAHKSLPVLGIMWHPERNEPFDAEDVLLFKKMFD